MQIGGENRVKVIAASILGLLAVGSALRTFVFSRPSAPRTTAVAATTTSPEGPSPSDLVRPARRTTASTAARTASKSAPSLDPRLQLGLLASSEGTRYSGTGRNIFMAQAIAVEKAKVNPAIAKTPPVPQGPPQPPPAPPINLKFFGFANKPGEPKRVFLSQDGDVFIAGEGEIVNRRYKVVRISPNAVEVEDLLYNHRQSLPLVQG